MHIDPHTLQQILQRIHQQMRCPQCGKRVPVDFSSVRVVGDEAMLLQVKCETCNAYIVLHASMQGAECLSMNADEDEALANASSSLQVGEKEVVELRQVLSGAEGKFSELFKDDAGSVSQ